VGREDRIPIEDQVPRRRVERERLAELLDDPRRRGVLGRLEPNDASSAMRDHEPDAEDAERHRRNDEEVHGGDSVAVVVEEHQPALQRVGLRSAPRHVP